MYRARGRENLKQRKCFLYDVFVRYSFVSNGWFNVILNLLMLGVSHASLILMHNETQTLTF